MSEWCDTDEGGEDIITPMPTHCTRFECNFDVYYMHGRKPTTRRDPPPLVRNRLGMMECTRCYSSYGRG